MDILNETDGSLNKPQEWGKAPTRMTSVNFDARLHEEAKRLNIPLRDAIEFGILFKKADIEGWDYPECNLLKKLQRIAKNFEAKAQECEALRSQLKNGEEEIDDDQAKKDLENVFGGVKDHNENNN